METSGATEKGHGLGINGGAQDALRLEHRVILFLLFIIARLTTLLDYEHTPSYHPTTAKINR